VDDRPDGRRGQPARRWIACNAGQDRLDEAIKNGASQEEIDQLMKEMQQALNEYMRELAEEAQRNPGDQQTQDGCRAR
jgi:arsenate reductase-like glutaredoxin family protein